MEKTKSSADTQLNKKEVEDFKGYTLEEVRYQRALLLLKKEFLREKALGEISEVKSRIPLLNGKSTLGSLSSKSMIGRVLKGLNYADYLMLGFSIFNAGKKVLSFMRKKKK